MPKVRCEVHHLRVSVGLGQLCPGAIDTGEDQIRYQRWFGLTEILKAPGKEPALGSLFARLRHQSGSRVALAD
tara:strand:+ start:282 stop:500 length:219 start_codon:yes stop_codon:yes gene_type:complete